MKYEKEITYCTFCPKLCRFVCPASEAVGDESRTPTFRASILYLWKKEDLPKDLLHRIYSCFLCRACREICYHEIEVPSYTVQARERLNERGLQAEECSELYERMKKHGNIFQKEFQNQKNSEVVLFPGCVYLTFYPEAVKKAERILAEKDLKFTTVEMCCGYPLYWMGYLKEFKAHTEKLKKTLKGVKKIISMCPHCSWYLKESGFEVRDLLDEISDFVEISVKRRISGSFFYHDPCYRTRYLEDEATARFLLSWVLETPQEEFLFSKKNTSCCGGLMMEFVDENLARQVTKMRLNETEGKPVIVSCPQCRKRFEEENHETYDLLELIYSAIYE